MPGLFDNSNSGGGGGGGILDGLTAALMPDYYYKRQAAQALARQNSPDDAAILMGNPQAYGLGFQRQLFLQQLNDLQQRNPNMSLNEALFRLSQEGQNQQYGSGPVPGFKSSSGAEAPGMRMGNQIIPPSGMSFQTIGPGAPSGTTGVQTQPTQQQAGQPLPISPIDQAGIDYNAAKAGAVARSESEAKAQPGLPNVITDANTTLQQISDLQNHPGLDYATGAVLGRLPGAAGPQNDFIQRFNALLDSTFFQTLQQAKAAGGRGGTNAAAALKASGRLLDPMSRTLTSQNFRKLLQDASDAISQYKKDAFYNAGSPPDLKDAANSFTPKPFQYYQGNPRRITSQQEYSSLKSGEQYYAPDGSQRTKR